ncbi:hypothetical protein BKA62DRAFT_789475 [Auriculariales sp. MPI-PUGE-AT-0066]|nr:hypothetical protein BKA62DRAFT_789475 [Auriculariales sp. MPI-PUGE-AT-0066]
MAGSAALPIYFESSWSILSIIGLWNVFVALILYSTLGWSRILLVPLVVSVATAISNGMCFYAFYMEYATVNTAVASAFADVFWVVQEAGLSFYSYIILARWLKGTARTIFLTMFWSLLAVIIALRGAILVSRIQFTLDKVAEPQTTARRQAIINHLHSGYFSAIALVELNSAFFLLRNFSRARRFANTESVLGHLMRSTEVRLALLALIGVTRAVTYSFQTAIQSANSVASQIDRFVYTTECLFPIVMFVDILASRLVASDGGTTSVSSRSRSRGRAPSKSVARQLGQTQTAGQSAINIHPAVDDESISEARNISISRTVEFEVYDGEGRRTDYGTKS